MVRYYFAWTPLFIVGTVVFLALPWLGLIALFVFSLAALALFAFAIVFVPYMLARSVGHAWHALTTASARPAPTLAPARRPSTSFAFHKS